MNRITASICGMTALLILGTGTVEAEDTRLPVTRAKEGFPLAEARNLEGRSTVASLLKGEDEALYWTTHVANSMPTAILPRVLPTKMLERNIEPGVGRVKAETFLGELELEEFLVDSRSFAQGIVVVHKGEVVYEKYPGMRPEQSHLWASNAKPLSSLLIDLLIDEGLIDQEQTFGHYVPDFRGTAWENIRIIDILDMTPGLDTEEDSQTRQDPDSIAIRTFLAEFNEPYARAGRVETLREILKDARKTREPGTSFDYGSPVTQALVLLTEEVTQKKWADSFQEKVWSRMYVEGSLQVHLAPDGTAAVHGLVSSRLRDMARFGLLYTPSWSQVAQEQIVTPQILDRIRDGVRGEDFYLAGYDGPIFTRRLNDRIMGNSRQWDAIFEDGDFFKGGLMGQGLYVSPDRDLVIAFFSTSIEGGDLTSYMRPLAKSGLFPSAGTSSFPEPEASTQVVPVLDEPLHVVKHRGENFLVYTNWIEPGVQTLYHEHRNDLLAVIAIDTTAESQAQGSQPREQSAPAGTLVFFPYAEEATPYVHRVGVGAHSDGPFINIGLEFQDSQKLDCSGEVAEWTEPLAEASTANRRGQGYQLTLPPGTEIDLPEGGRGLLFVPLGPASLTVDAEKWPVKVGDFRFDEKQLPQRLGNTGASAATLVVFEAC